MSDFTIEKLPFYWRLSPVNNKSLNVVDDYFPFSFDYDPKYGLLIQRRNEQVLEALDSVYKQEYNIGYLQDGNEIAKPYGRDFIAYIHTVLKNNPSIKKILEIGCGGCVVLEDMKQQGYEVCGIDSSPFAATEGAKKGIDVVTDFFPSKLMSGKFDLIFHVDVLEHISSYVDFLKSQYEQLNDNGLVIVNVPDATESIEVGDISMAMHQHLNYFTEDSLSAVLQAAGFEVLFVNKAGYGGSLYAVGRRTANSHKPHSKLVDLNVYEKFVEQAQRVISSFEESSNRVLSNKKRSLGYYVPLRTLPYIAKLGLYEGFRFFDDTAHWHDNVFDGVDVPIENFADLKREPVTDLIVMSLTFGEVIKKKVQNEFGDSINVITLNDLIYRDKK